MSAITQAILEDRVHFGTSKSQLVSAFVAAGVATVMATAFGYWFKSLGWTPFDFNTLNGFVWSGAAAGLGVEFTPNFVFTVGAWAHYLQGIVFGLIFVFAAHPNLPGELNPRSNLLKGLVWGWLLWLVSSSFLMPLLFGSGFLFSVWGYPNLFYNFIWHTIYGLHLGILYNPMMKMMR